jgi:hypothetical protein
MFKKKALTNGIHGMKDIDHSYKDQNSRNIEPETIKLTHITSTNNERQMMRFASNNQFPMMQHCISIE